MLSFPVRRIWLLVALFALVTATGAVVAWQGWPAPPDPSGAAVERAAQDEDGEDEDGEDEDGEDEDGDICPPGHRECEVEDGQVIGSEGQGGGDGSGGGSGACTWTRDDDGVVLAALAAAAQTTIEIPCYLSGRGWYGGDACYYGDFPPVREATGGIPDPPDGKTGEDGRYYYLSCFFNVEVYASGPVFWWQLNERWVWVDYADVPQVTPEQVVNAWLASVTLDGVEFRLAPPESGAGLVGLPVWLGVNTESVTAWGPNADSDCIGSVCVAIEALVVSVDWQLGDGTVVSCQRDQHVAWQRGVHDFLAPGGNCHHYYQQAGVYEITATSHWEVRWSTTTDSGMVPTERTSTVDYHVTEIQVLTGR